MSKFEPKYEPEVQEFKTKYLMEMSAEGQAAFAVLKRCYEDAREEYNRREAVRVIRSAQCCDCTEKPSGYPEYIDCTGPGIPYEAPTPDEAGVVKTLIDLLNTISPDEDIKIRIISTGDLEELF